MRSAPLAALAAAWMGAVVLAVDPAGWYPFGPLRWAVVSAGLAGLAAVAIARRRVVVAPALALVSVALAATFAIAAAFGLDGRYAWLGTPERHLGALTWAMLAVALAIGTGVERPDLVATGASVAGLALGVAATAEALGWEPRVFDVDDRLSATFGSPAYLGAAAALFLPIAVGTGADRDRPRAVRAAAIVAAGTLAVAVLGSGARAAWVGLAVAAGAVAVRRHAVRTVGAWPRRHVGLAAAGALAAVVLVAVLTPVGGRASALFDADAPGGRGRLDEWRVAAHVLPRHALVGVGPEGYRIAFAEGVDAAYERAHGRTPAPDRAHSGPLDIALTGGVGALALWLAIVVLVGRHVWRALADERRWLAGVGAALVAHVTGQLVLFPLAEVEPMAWLLAGVVVAATARPGELRAWRPSIRPARLATAGATALAVVGFVVALVAGTTDVIADRRARASVVAARDGDPERALARAVAAAQRRPDEVRLHLLVANAALGAGRGTVEALRAIDDALAIAPRDPIVVARECAVLVDRAEATLVPAHASTALEATTAARVRDPYDAELLVLDGRAAHLAGDDERAERSWRAAEDLAPRSPVPAANLALLYASLGRVDDARGSLARAVAIAPDDEFVTAVRTVVERDR